MLPGDFSKEFTGLTGSTTYKYKAYATNNSCETSYGYGSEVEFTTLQLAALLHLVLRQVGLIIQEIGHTFC